jgi:hypothetical protein
VYDLRDEASVRGLMRVRACRLSQLLQQEEDWQQESVSLDEQALTILCTVIQKYKEQGDKLSATVLAEATCTALARLAATHESLQQLEELATSMFDELMPQEKDMVRSPDYEQKRLRLCSIASEQRKEERCDAGAAKTRNS